MTGNSYESDVKKFTTAGLNDLILKPANIKVILHSIETSLKKEEKVSITAKADHTSDVKNLKKTLSEIIISNDSLTWFTALMIITIIVMLIPLFIEFEDVKYIPVGVVNANEYFYAQIVYITIFAILNIDLIFNYALIYTKSNTMINIASIYTVSYHVALVCYLIPIHDMKTMWVLFTIRGYLIGITLILFLIKNGDPVWNKGWCSFISCMGASIYMIATEYSFCLCTVNSISGVIAMIACPIFFGSLIFNSVKYYYCQMKDKNLSVTVLGVTISLNGCLCAVILPFVTNIEHPLSELTTPYLIIYDVIVLSCSVLTIYINQRTEIEKSCSSIHDTIKARESLVKHITHDIRNLLSIIMLGTSHAQNECVKSQLDSLNTLFNYFDKSNCTDVTCILQKMISELKVVTETIQMCEESCNIALDKVCDLVNYEKLESCDFHLQLINVNGIDYINKFLDDYKSKFHDTQVTVLYDSKVSKNFDIISINIDIEKMEYVWTSVFSKLEKGSEVILDIMVQSKENDKYDSKVVNNDTILFKITSNLAMTSIANNRSFTKDIFMTGNDDPDVEYSLLDMDLRLYICHGIIKLHDGSFSVSENGKECSFTLPIKYMDDVNGEYKIVPSTLQCHNYCKINPLRILIIDNTELNKNPTITSLSTWGICKGIPDVVSDGIKAIEMVENSITHEPYDLILMDYEMPVMNGSEVCRECRKVGYCGPVGY